MHTYVHWEPVSEVQLTARSRKPLIPNLYEWYSNLTYYAPKRMEVLKI